MAEWSKLPNDILLLIAKRLETRIDLLRFRSVCTSWRSSVPPQKPRWLKIPTYDTQVADHFYLSESAIYLVQSRENPDQTTPPDCWFIMIRKDKFGSKHLPHQLTNSKITSTAFRKVYLNCSKLQVHEWITEYVLQYTPKDKTCIDSAYHEERNLMVQKVAFMSSSPGSKDFVLLASGVPRKFAFLFKSSTWERTKIERYSYCYDVARFSVRLFAVDECRKTIAIHPTSGVSIDIFCGESFFKDCLHEASLIELNDTSFSNFYMGKRLVSVKSLGEIVLFLNSNSHCSFYAHASKLSGCKGNCIVFSVPSRESMFLPVGILVEFPTTGIRA
ncbi:F-box protein SKIP23 [Quercus suber]|uniref:F-box protein SKIP23 n=1 Tax=Quercus suber TaxID=58331 RepID=UPI0032DF9838